MRQYGPKAVRSCSFSDRGHNGFVIIIRVSAQSGGAFLGSVPRLSD